MSLKRILQMLASFFTGQGVSIITQLLVPPFFLHRYANGLEVYGEWIALSAAVNYLGTLNYGIQTYASNQMTIDYNRGEIAAAKSVQASAFRLMVLIIAVLGTVGAGVLFLPVSRWMGLKHLSAASASLTLYLFILQILLNMILALMASGYMAVGKTHRGVNWTSAQRLVSALLISVCIWFRAPFPALASVQLACLILFTLVVMVDARRISPILVPSLRDGSWAGVRAILKPSAHFGLYALSGFLTWQGPVLLIEKILGPAAVAVFSLARVVFALGRQGLGIASFSISQEITHLIGQRSWVQLKRLYDLSERVVLLLIPVFSVGFLLLAPFLFTVWMHKRNLYDPLLCFLMAMISAVMGIKEHKSVFQSSSNEHEQLARFALVTYAVTLSVSIFLVKRFGVPGYMFAWLAAETVQLVYILRLNVRLFPRELKISTAPVLRLAAVMTVAFGIAAWPAFHSMQWPLTTVVAMAAGITLALTVVSYCAFGLNEVRSVIESRIRRRLATPV